MDGEAVAGTTLKVLTKLAMLLRFVWCDRALWIDCNTMYIGSHLYEGL
jgi:hypothetical protein